MTEIQGAFAHKLPPAEPTLRDLALAALGAELAEQCYDWQGPGDRGDLVLWRAKIAARDAFFDRLQAETGIDRALFQKVAEL